VKPGISKTAVITKEYVITVNDLLSRGMVFFEEDWFTNTPVSKKKGGKEEVADELRDQLCRYCYDENGKLTGKIQGSQDDLYVGFAMLCYWSLAIETCPAHEKYRS
jgi:hypothetical protein